MDHSYRYIASLTREPFLFYEMRSTAKLMAEGNSDDAIVKEIVVQNLFQYPTEKSITRMAKACIKRLHALEDDGGGCLESYLTKVGIDMGVDEKNIYNVTVQNGQAIIANDNSSVTATTNIGATANDIEQLIAAVRTKMDTLTSDEDKEAASESLEVIEAEVISEKPKKSMIKTAIASLQAIKGTVEFGSAVAALIQFVVPLLS